MQGKGWEKLCYSIHLILEVKRDKNQAGPAALTSAELPTSQELIPVLPWKKNPWMVTSLTAFYICTAVCLMRWRCRCSGALVKCRMHTPAGSGGSLETWTNDPLFSGRFILPLIDTEMPPQLHISEAVILTQRNAVLWRGFCMHI